VALHHFEPLGKICKRKILGRKLVLENETRISDEDRIAILQGMFLQSLATHNGD
jgi:hypothetical protein